MQLSTPQKIKTVTVTLTLLLVSLAQIPSTILAADNIDISRRIMVGVTDFPPFALKNAEGKWSGLSIELWELIAKDIGVQYEIREFNRLKKITEAIQNEKIDLTTYVAVTELNETKMDLSHAYYRSGLGIAVPLQSSSIHWSESVRQIVSISGLKLVAILVILSLVAGVMIWLVERNHNREMFDDKFTKGLLQGIWWAMVTMTTVGYGDKAPRTIRGRFIAVLWMFFSIFLIASYTAVITSSLTVNELSGRVKGPRDLPDVRVGALSRSETFDHLEAEGIPVKPFDNHNEGLRAVANDQIDAFVDDELQLKYIIKNDFPGQLHVLPEVFSQYYVSMAMPSASQIREQVNRTLPRILDQKAWTEVRERYFGRIR